jgi:hypothetical protein
LTVPCLEERRSSRAHGAKVEIINPGGSGDRLQNALEKVAQSVSGAGGGRKEESSRIVPLRMLRHPRFQIPREAGRDGDPGIGRLGFGLSDAFRTLLLFLNGFVNAESISADVFNAQGEATPRDVARKTEGYVE